MKKQLLILIITLLSGAHLSGQNTTIQVNGTTRNMYVYAPANLKQNRPLLISLHGMNQDITYQRNQAKWESLADTANILVVYPAGINNQWDISGNKDVQFLSAIISKMYQQYKIDTTRVYLSGFSMGSMMTYHAMNTMADKFAAFGPVSGYTLSNPSFTSSRPVPIIHVHGEADDVVYFTAKGGQVGVAAIMEGWRKRNGCSDNPTVIKPYPTNKPSSGATMTHWTGGECGSEIVMISLPGKGHWHSNDDNGVNTTREIWNFVRQYSTKCGKLTSLSVTAAADSSVYQAPATIHLTAKVSGAATKVEFFTASAKIGECSSAPYSYNWTPVKAGQYVVTAVAIDQAGSSVTSAPISLTVHVPQSPYSGTATNIPGLIQAENFDNGGEGIAYHDVDTANQGGAYRHEGVDIKGDATDGYRLGWTVAGEWLEYTVNVQKSATYKWQARVATENAQAAFHLQLDGVNLTPVTKATNTGSWTTFAEVGGVTPLISAGNHVLRVVVDSSYFDFDWLKFTSVDASGIQSVGTCQQGELQPGIYQVYNLLGMKVGSVAITTGEQPEQAVRQLTAMRGVYILRGAAGAVLKVYLR